MCNSFGDNAPQLYGSGATPTRSRIWKSFLALSVYISSNFSALLPEAPSRLRPSASMIMCSSTQLLPGRKLPTLAEPEAEQAEEADALPLHHYQRLVA